MSFDQNGPTVLVMVLDAVGVPTLNYLLSNHRDSVYLPNFTRLGLGNILDPQFHDRITPSADAHFAAAVEQASASADSVIGHREMTGVIDPRTYDLFPNGFPPEYIAALEAKIGRKTIFNQMAGGDDAIARNAAEHARTGNPIVYASICDPLVQIAMDEKVIPLKEQYAIVDTAFALAQERGVRINRVIARPYVISGNEHVRTANRHDVVLPLEQQTLVGILRENGIYTSAVAKTGDLVTTRFDETRKVTNHNQLGPYGLSFPHPKMKDTNPFSFQATLDALVAAQWMNRPQGTFIFSNLVDTDSVYGHTRDVTGALRCLEEIDRGIPILESHMKPGDVLIITADHGMEHKPDYGYHSREAVPVLARRVGSDELRLGVGNGKTLADVGYLAAQVFGCEKKFVQECGLGQYYS